MPQGPIATQVYAKNNVSKVTQPLVVDAAGLLANSAGGLSSSLDVTAAAVIKATAGRLCKIVIVNAGTTGGAFTINDCATTAAATAANAIWSAPFNGTGVVAGGVFTLDWPCATGIVVSAVPSGGTPIISVSWA